MARLGRRQPQQSRLRQPAAIGPAVVFRALRVWLADPLRPIHRVTARAAHSQLREPTKVSAPSTFRPLSQRLADGQLPQQVVTSRGVGSRLQSPTVVGVPAAPFVASPVKVRSVAVFAQQAAGAQRRAPLSKLNAPAIIAAAVTFDPVSVTMAAFVQQAAGGQRRAPLSRLQPPTAIGPANVPAPIRAKLTRRPINYLATSSRLQLPTVVDPLATPTLAQPLATTLAPQPTRYSRRPKYTLRPPTVVDPFVPPPAGGARLRTLVGAGL